MVDIKVKTRSLLISLVDGYEWSLEEMDIEQLFSHSIEELWVSVPAPLNNEWDWESRIIALQ